MSKAKIIKGLLSLFKEKTSKNKAKRIIASGEDPAELGFAKTVDMGPPRDPGVDYETAAALKKSRKIFDAQQKNLNPLQEEMDRMLALEKSNLDKLKIQSAEMEEMTKVLDEFNRIADEDGMEEALKALEGLMNPKRTLNADGGRVGMLSGGLAKGIMQAVNAARKGFKPFGEKQTYKQNLQNLGLANENALVNNFTNRLEKIMKTRQSQIPEDDLYDLFENIATGKQYDMVSTPIKKDMLAAVMQAMRKRNVDGSDFQNFIADIAPKTKRDILPNDVQSLLKQIDESDAFIEQLRGKPSSKIVPFKPKTKKANGGRIGFKDGDKVDTMFEPRYDSSSGEYDVKGGAKVGPFDISVGGRGNENYDMSPIMEYEAGLDLPNDFRLTGGYYDDAIMEDGMMSPEDQIRLQIEKRFNKGGLVPPKKGPVSDGMGSLFRRK